MSLSTFTVKQIRLTFVLSPTAAVRSAGDMGALINDAAPATFDSSGSNTLVVSGLRCSATIQGSGFPSFPQMELTVFGMKQSDMNRLTSLQFQPLGLNRHTVIVETNAGAGWSIAYAGQIITSGPDYTAAPDVALRVSAQVLGFEALNPATPTGYSGATPVATIVQAIAAKMARVFENNGVSIQLSSPYFAGTLTEQLRAVGEAANIDIYTPPNENVVAICPRGVARQAQVFVLSKETGLVGYPTLDYSRGFINVRSLYNPAYRMGGPIKISGSSIPIANGDWIIGPLSHQIESVKPEGLWFSDLLLYPPGTPAPPLQ